MPSFGASGKGQVLDAWESLWSPVVLLKGPGGRGAFAGRAGVERTAEALTGLVSCAPDVVSRGCEAGQGVGCLCGQKRAKRPDPNAAPSLTGGLPVKWAVWGSQVLDEWESRWPPGAFADDAPTRDYVGKLGRRPE